MHKGCALRLADQSAPLAMKRQLSVTTGDKAVRGESL